MSEITMGMPEGQTPKATIINFEASKAKRFEEKNRHAQWIQECTQKPPRNGVDAAIPATSRLLPEANQTPKRERQDAFSANDEGKTGENRYPAAIKNNVFDFQKAREKRLVDEQENPPVDSENSALLQPSPVGVCTVCVFMPSMG